MAEDSRLAPVPLLFMTAGTLRVAAKVSDAWINFARLGDPNHSAIPHWPSFTADQCPTMIFDTECVMKGNPDGAERKVLTET